MEKRNSRIGINLKKTDSFFSKEKKIGTRRVREEIILEKKIARTEPEGIVPAEKPSITIRLLEYVIGFSMLALFFGIPLFFTGFTLQGVVFEKQFYFYFWLLIGLIAWTTKGVVVGELGIRRTPLDFPILGFWLAVLVSAIFSIDRWHSFWGAFSDPSRGLMNITALVIAYYFIFSNLSSRRTRNIIASLMLSGLIVSVWTLLAIRNIKFLPDNLAALSPISLTGSMMGVVVIISALIPLITVAILKVAENESLKKVTKMIFITLLSVYLALSLFLVLALYNFISWIGFFVGISLLLIFVLSQIVRPKSSLSWIPLVVFVAVMIIRMVGPDMMNLAKINISEARPLDFGNSRQIAQESLKNNFLIGSGPATYGYNFSLSKPKEFNNNIFYNLRYLQGTGVIIEAVSTLGALGSFFLITLFLSFLSIAIYLMSRDKERNKLLSLGILSSAMVLVFDIAFTKMEGTVLIMGVLLATLALATLTSESDSQKKDMTLSLKASPKFALALAFVSMVVSAGVVFLFVFLGKVYVGDVYAAKAMKSNSDKTQSLINLASAIKYSPREAKYYVQAGQDFMLLANQEAMQDEASRDVNEIKTDIADSISQANKGFDMNSKDVSVVEIVAQIYENAGLYDSVYLKDALDKYQKASDLEPHNPVFYTKMGQVKLGMASSQKDANQKKQLISEAKDLFAKSIDEKQDLSDGYYQLSIAQSASGETDQAIINAEKAFSLSKGNNADYTIGLARLYQDRGKEDDLKSAEQLYKLAIGKNDKNINAHFYLGVLYEKQKKLDDAKAEYEKVASLMTDDKNTETKKQVEKMISNIEAGIENTPESLGLVSSQEQAPEADDSEIVQ